MGSSAGGFHVLGRFGILKGSPRRGGRYKRGSFEGLFVIYLFLVLSFHILLLLMLHDVAVSVNKIARAFERNIA